MEFWVNFLPIILCSNLFSKLFEIGEKLLKNPLSFLAVHKKGSKSNFLEQNTIFSVNVARIACNHFWADSKLVGTPSNTQWVVTLFSTFLHFGLHKDPQCVVAVQQERYCHYSRYIATLIASHSKCSIFSGINKHGWPLLRHSNFHKCCKKWGMKPWMHVRWLRIYYLKTSSSCRCWMIRKYV